MKPRTWKAWAVVLDKETDVYKSKQYAKKYNPSSEIIPVIIREVVKPKGRGKK